MTLSKKHFAATLFMGLLLVTTGCQTTRELPRESSGYAKLNERLQQEQEHLHQARQKQRARLEKEKPGQESETLTPVAPEFNPLQETSVSISVHNRPLQDVLYVIARDAGLNLVISPEISLDNRVTISFDSTPASVVVDRLLEAYDLAWSVDDNVLAVRPYQEEIFELDFLNANTQVSIQSGGDIFGNAGTDTNGGGGSNDLAGNFSMQSSFGEKSNSNSLYGFLKANIEDILSTGEEQSSGRFVLDSTAGTLYVRASPANMRIVRRFVHQMQNKLSQQVSIDAQILEVELSDSFQLGVDWSYVANRLMGDYAYDINLGWKAAQGFGTYALGEDDPQALVMDSRTEGVDPFNQFSATIDALKTFGAVHVVSNPHVRTRHMQPALVTSGTTQNYIEEITRSRSSSGNSGDDWVDFSTETATAFEGVMLGVVPFITEQGNIDLNIFPITSQVDLSRKETIGEDQITLPTVDVRNVNTNVRVTDGDTVILGGLIQKNKNDNDRKTPAIANVPGLGWLFKQRSDSRSLSELVVIMHVRVL